jgi:hypothetical protein
MVDAVAQCRASTHAAPCGLVSSAGSAHYIGVSGTRRSIAFDHIRAFGANWVEPYGWNHVVDMVLATLDEIATAGWSL